MLKPGVLSAAGLLVAIAFAAVAQHPDSVTSLTPRVSDFQYQTFRVPGSQATGAHDINASGRIVGAFLDNRNVLHGFLRKESQFFTIDPPGAITSAANGINDAGRIVGYWEDAQGVHGYVKEGSTFSKLDPPGSTEAQAGGISDDGRIVGYFSDARGKRHGFLYQDGLFSTIDMPGATHTVAWKINNAGEIVGFGFFEVGSRFFLRGFLFAGGTFRAIDVPADQVFSTVPGDLNQNGQVVVGSYQDDRGKHAFLADRNVFLTLPLPDDFGDAAANGINNKGEIVGQILLLDPSTNLVMYHGYIGSFNRAHR